ncbi:MAG TPA: hypothetical protein VJU13_08945 [Candidatus Nitrosocosmicus sp.]|nr:hypothetical protein [Candidatus Nitrosocosmicus sp.]
MSLNFNSKIEDEAETLLKQELERIFRSVFKTNRKILDGLNEIKTANTWYQEAKQNPANTWYQEAKQNPDNIPNIILNHCISTIIKYVQPVLTRYLIDTFDFKIRFERGKLTVDHFFMEFSVKPFVEFIRKINGQPAGSVKLVFEISMTGKMEKIQFRSSMGRRQFTVDKLSTLFDISILEGSIISNDIHFQPFKKPIKLYHRELFEIENLTFTI